MHDEHLLADVIRFFLGIVACWIAVLIWRAGWRRHRTERNHPSLWFYASYSLALFLLAALRWQHIEKAPTWDLWVACIIVGLAAVGVLRSWRLTRSRIRAPHTREPH